jgi:hypothetical protein
LAQQLNLNLPDIFPQATLKKCRQTLKEVRHYQRSLRMSNGSLELMADNLTSLVENLKTKSGERMEHFKEEKDFMQSLVKVFSWRYRIDKLNKQSLDEVFVI